VPPEIATIPKSQWTPPTRARVTGIRRALQGIYGVPAPPPHRRPVDELVLTLLSQSTSDRNRDVAFLRLRERFADWAAVREAPQPEVEAAIQPGGLHRTKSVRLQQLLREIGDSDLSHLESVPVEQARAELCGLPGVGRKTTACVLLFAYHRRDVPVDTHVGRVSTRLGLLRPGAPSEEQHDAFLALTPRGAELELHVNLLRHGRRTCHAQRPACPECVLRSRCPSRRA
jgi:endonuclease-3